jgi:CBS domain-containing protein
MQDSPVASLMTEPVLTVESDESPSELAEGMVELGIKSVVVTDGECHPEGIITSTDYLRMAADGADPAETTVAEWMTADIITLTANQNIERAADLMQDNEINHLPIVDGAGEAVGIVTATDLTAYLAEED